MVVNIGDCGANRLVPVGLVRARTTNEQREQAFQMMKERGWITFYMEPIWHDQRWVLTERGLTALEGM